MIEDEPLPPLAIGDAITAAITVRGGHITEAIALQLAVPALTRWEYEQANRLPADGEYEHSDAFAPNPQGEYSVTRTLTVRARA